MKLYAFPLSPFSAKVRIALAEKGVRYETIDLPTNRAGVVSKPAEMTSINPRGQVPVLVDGELGIYDSTVIVEYLEDRYPTPPLYPRDPAGRARCRQLEDAGDDEVNLSMVPLVAEVYRKSDAASRDAAKIAAAHARLAAFGARIERALDGKEWLCDAFSVADISCYVALTMCAFLGAAPARELTRTNAWLARMLARPSCARDRAMMLEEVKRQSA